MSEGINPGDSEAPLNIHSLLPGCSVGPERDKDKVRNYKKKAMRVTLKCLFFYEMWLLTGSNKAMKNKIRFYSEAKKTKKQTQKQSWRVEISLKTWLSKMFC